MGATHARFLNRKHSGDKGTATTAFAAACLGAATASYDATSASAHVDSALRRLELKSRAEEVERAHVLAAAVSAHSRRLKCLAAHTHLSDLKAASAHIEGVEVAADQACVLHLLLRALADGLPASQPTVPQHALLSACAMLPLFAAQAPRAPMRLCSSMATLRSLVSRAGVVVDLSDVYQALGTHARTLTVTEGVKLGVAASPDGAWLVVGHCYEGTLAVYSLPSCTHVRTFGGRWTPGAEASAPAFKLLARLCFTPAGNILAVDPDLRALVEVTLAGSVVGRWGVSGVGATLFGDSQPRGADVCGDVVAVGLVGGHRDHGALTFSLTSGSVLQRFGVASRAMCTSVRFSPSGRHVVVAETNPNRLSLYMTAGAFVAYLGAGVLGGGDKDLVFTGSGEFIVVADQEHHRVCVFAADGYNLVSSWGANGTEDGQFNNPTALAVAGPQLFVLDRYTARVQVFL